MPWTLGLFLWATVVSLVLVYADGHPRIRYAGAAGCGLILLSAREVFA